MNRVKKAFNTCPAAATAAQLSQYSRHTTFRAPACQSLGEQSSNQPLLH